MRLPQDLKAEVSEAVEYASGILYDEILPGLCQQILSSNQDKDDMQLSLAIEAEFNRMLIARIVGNKKTEVRP